jgi:hypothetical protein
VVELLVGLLTTVIGGGGGYMWVRHKRSTPVLAPGPVAVPEHVPHENTTPRGFVTVAEFQALKGQVDAGLQRIDIEMATVLAHMRFTDAKLDDLRDTQREILGVLMDIRRKY